MNRFSIQHPMLSKNETAKLTRAKSATTASLSSQQQHLNGYLDPLTAIPGAYKPRWKILWDKVRERRQDGVDPLVKEQGIRLTERNLKELFNPEHDPEAEFDIDERSKGSDEDKKTSRVNEWMQGLP
jgi:hypothetical protein